MYKIKSLRALFKKDSVLFKFLKGEDFYDRCLAVKRIISHPPKLSKLLRSAHLEKTDRRDLRSRGTRAVGVQLTAVENLRRNGEKLAAVKTLLKNRGKAPFVDGVPRFS